jgi:hypothetical protein
MTTAFRRTAGRLAAACLATAALTGAAVAGAQAATAATSCDESPLGRTFDVVLSLRNADLTRPPTCR